MVPRGRWIAALGAAGLVAGCAGGSRRAPESVLRTEDFIADPATMPTARPASPTVVATTRESVVPPAASAGESAASEPLPRPLDITIEQGPPPLLPINPAEVTEPPILVDAKIGEINGRAIRVEEMFELVGSRLAATARTRTLSPSEWMAIGQKPPSESQPATRANWIALAEALFRGTLSGILQDELLAAEARAGLKPEQRMGLRAFVQESREVQRRIAGGSSAELERQLRDKNQNEQRFGRQVESRILIDMQLEEQVRNRYKASWKDVKRFYQRNLNMFRPSAIARFRLIVVPASDTAGVAAVRDALASGQKFETVAALAANQFNAAEGGLFGEGQTAIQGDYATATPFSFDELNAAAQKLSPGQFTQEPVTRTDGSGGTILTWLCLETLSKGGGSLGDPDVQLAIVDRLNGEARTVGREAYISRLVKRATFSDLDEMTRTLVDIAAERYWPAGR